MLVSNIDPMRVAIVTATRECLGTPFRRHGRIPGIGLDCFGLVLHVSNKLGLAELTEFTEYGDFPDQRLVLKMLDEHLDRVHGGLVHSLPGDILLVASLQRSVHLGVLLETDTFVHAAGLHPKCVVPTKIDEAWFRLVRGVWRFRYFRDK